MSPRHSGMCRHSDKGWVSCIRPYLQCKNVLVWKNKKHSFQPQLLKCIAVPLVSKKLWLYSSNTLSSLFELGWTWPSTDECWRKAKKQRRRKVYIVSKYNFSKNYWSKRLNDLLTIFAVLAFKTLDALAIVATNRVYTVTSILARIV